MRRTLACLAALFLASPAFAQPAENPPLPVELARLTFDVCAPVLERGAGDVMAVLQSAAETGGLDVSDEGPLSALRSDFGPRFARMLGAGIETPVRMVGPRTQAADTFITSVLRMDAKGCVILARGGEDTLAIVRARLAQASGTWAYEASRNGARLYRRLGEGELAKIRLVLAPRQNPGGSDQVIFFIDETPAAAQPEE